MVAAAPKKLQMPLLLVAAVLVLSAGNTWAQIENTPCGPSHRGKAHGTWMKIPASQLVATAPAGTPARAGSDGCVTSDTGYAANVHVYLPNGTWHIYNVTARLRAAKSSNAAMSILVGDADVPAVMQMLRAPGGASKLSTVLKHFTTCGIMRMSKLATAAPATRSFDCDLSKTDSTGQYFGFVAPGLTVCDVMICARQSIFTSHGTPLTRQAALMLTDAAAGIRAAATDNPWDASAASAVAPMSARTCPGYTTSAYNVCPEGQECTRTYKPGDDVCDCGDCSAFTGRRSCEWGDLYVGSESCCFTCPYQPICGVCQTPCQRQFQKIEIEVGTLPTTPDSYTTVAYQYESTTDAVNKGNNAQTVTVTFTFSQALTATMTYAKEFGYSEKSTVEIGIPFLNKAALEFTATQKFTTTTTNTDTRTTTIAYSLSQQIPGLTAQTVTAKTSAGIITVKVPIKVKTYYTCDYMTTEDNFAVIQTQGVMTSVESDLSITYGPQYPLSPPVVYGQANQTCASNPYCAQFGLKGNCCPDDNGKYNSCCSFCFLKQACEEFAQDNTTMCCPSITNVKNPCCG